MAESVFQVMNLTNTGTCNKAKATTSKIFAGMMS